MADQGTGIQELMAAETRASQIVAEARIGTLFVMAACCCWQKQNISRPLMNEPKNHTGRGDRMKQAKVEAQALIGMYRSEKQAEFNNMVLSKGGSEGSASAKLQADTNKEIQELSTQFQKNAQKAVDVLLSKCCEVSLEVPTACVRSTQKAAGIVQ
jgi:ATP synthase subunit G